MKIAHKLQLSFLGLIVAVLAATLMLASWSFERGFLDYVNALEETRLQAFAKEVANYYEPQTQTWQLNQRQFMTLVGDHLRHTIRRAASEPGGLNPNRGGPPHPNMLLPKPERTLPEGRINPGQGMGPNIPPEMGEILNRFNHPEKLLSTALYTTDGDFIVGDIRIESIHPIKVPVTVNGETVAELRSYPRRHFDTPQATAFSRQQWMTSAIIAVVTIIIAILASSWLTRMLLAPVLRSIKGVARLSAGDYESRLDELRDDELGQLMTDLDGLAHSLQENRSARQRWIADISHELRTPVTILTGEIEMLKDGIRPLNMQQVKSLDQEISRLRSLIDDLYQLSVSDIGGLHYNFESVPLLEVIESSVANYTNLAQQKGIAINISASVSPNIRADANRLTQLFLNLLQNSLSYTDVPGEIRVTLSEDERDKSVLVMVEDTPPGVSPQACKLLFEPLYRIEESRNRSSAGAGLGLAICLKIAEAHNATISAYPAALGGLGVRIKFKQGESRDE